MLIIWSGWGILVPVFNVVGVFLFGLCLKTFDATHPAPTAHLVFMGFDAIIWGGLAALGLFIFAQRRAALPGRTLVDPQTNQRIVFRKSAGSFFFIPTRYWSFITLGVWVVGVGIAIANGGKLG